MQHSIGDSETRNKRGREREKKKAINAMNATHSVTREKSSEVERGADKKVCGLKLLLMKSFENVTMESFHWKHTNKLHRTFLDIEPFSFSIHSFRAIRKCFLLIVVQCAANLNSHWNFVKQYAWLSFKIDKYKEHETFMTKELFQKS